MADPLEPPAERASDPGRSAQDTSVPQAGPAAPVPAPAVEAGEGQTAEVPTAPAVEAADGSVSSPAQVSADAAPPVSSANTMPPVPPPPLPVPSSADTTTPVPPSSAPPFADALPPAPASAGAAAPSPTRGDGSRRRKKRWVLVAAALAVVLAIGGGALAVYSYFFQRGASSPDGVMSTVSQAIIDKDVISLFKMISPEEIDTVTNSADEIREAGGSDLDALLSQDAINGYLESLTVSSSEMTYNINQKSNDLALVSISSWRLDASVDQSLANTLRNNYKSAKGSPLNDEENDFFSSLDFSNASYDDDIARDVTKKFDIPLEVVLVREEGRWYLSPLMTYGQWYYQHALRSYSDIGKPDYKADFASVQGADSPERAVENLTEQILDARGPRDLIDDKVTGLLSLPERRLVMVYGPAMIDSSKQFYERGSEHVKVDWRLTSTDIGHDQAVVHPGESTITLNPHDEDTKKVTLTFNDGSVDVRTSATENNRASVDFTRQLANPELLGVVTEKSNGTWHVSTSGTIVNILGLRPSERALDSLSDILEDLGAEPDKADDLADTITQSVAVATPVLVVVDIVEQLKDVEWSRSRSYDGYYDQCSQGNMASCDSLYYSSPSGSANESFGKSCGGRNYSLGRGGQCEARYGTWY